MSSGPPFEEPMGRKKMEGGRVIREFKLLPDSEASHHSFLREKLQNGFTSNTLLPIIFSSETNSICFKKLIELIFSSFELR